MISIDNATKLASDRYEAHFESLKAHGFAAFNARSAMALETPTLRMATLNSVFIAQEREHALVLAADLRSEAQNAVASFFSSQDQAAREAVGLSTIEALTTSLSAHVLNDANAVVSAVNAFHFQLKNISRAKGIDYASAMRHIRSEDFPIESSHLDARKRSWQGPVYVRALWRQMGVTVRAESTLTAIADHKQDRAIVLHPEEAHASNGLVVGVSGDLGYPTWNEIRARHFHPNSRAMIAPYGGERGFSLQG